MSGRLACTIVLLLLLLLARPALATEWYVNINTGDSANSGTSAGTAKKYISNVTRGTLDTGASLLAAGDTIHIAAGTYGETVVIDTNYIWCLGADSRTTIIDPPGDSKAAGLYAILCSNVQGVVIRDLAVWDARYAIWFDNVDTSVIESDSVGWTWSSGIGDAAISLRNGSRGNLVRNCYVAAGAHGINAWSSDSNTFAGNTVVNMAGGGLFMGGNSNLVTGNYVQSCAQGNIGTTASGSFNVFAGNITCSGSQSGLSIFNSSSGNQVYGNSAYGNTYEGIRITTTSTNNAVFRNFVYNNGRYGIQLDNSDANLVYANDVYGGATGDTLIHVSGSSHNDTITRNNLYGNFRNAYGNASTGTHVVTYNYWNTTREDTLAKMVGFNVPTAAWLPYRLGQVDTAAGADTVAPETTAITGADTSAFYEVTLTFAAVTKNQDGSALDDFLGYRIYRTQSDTETDWKQNAFLRAWGSAPSDSIFTDTMVAANTTYIYRITAVDNHAPWENESWFSDTVRVTTAMVDTAGPNRWYVNVNAGDTANHGLAAAAPKKYLGNILAGRNRFVSLLTQGDTVFIAAGTYTETFAIDTDHIAIIGADSQTTTLDYGDSSGSNPGPAFISADTRTGLIIRDLGITNILRAIRWRGITNGRIENTWLRHCGRDGYGAGLDLAGCTTLALHNNVIYKCGNGIDLANCGGLTVSNNLLDSNFTVGIFADMCPAAVMTGNTSRNNGSNGFEAIVDCDDWYVANNVAAGNGGAGFYSDLSARGRYVNNVSDNNRGDGFELIVCHALALTGNRVAGNQEEGAQGLRLWRCDSAVLSGNDIDSNGAYAVYLDSGTADIAVKNNLRAGMLYPDSLVFSAAPDTPCNLTRNYWGTTDSAAISSHIRGPGAGKVSWVPFRLGRVDTAAGADTIAPAAPDSASVSDSSLANTSCTLVWTAASTNEEIGGALTDLAGYRVYRARTSDTSYWALIGSAAATALVDSGLVAGETYYYRITAYDNHSPWPNESWYSDTIVCVLMPPKPGDFVHSDASANVVDAADLAWLNAQAALYWGVAPGDSRCDLNSDGILAFEDIAIFAVLFGS